jgi:hypothetical protein
MHVCHPPRVIHFSFHSGFVLDYVEARYPIQPVVTTYSSTFLRSRTSSLSSSAPSPSSASPSFRERRFERVFLRTIERPTLGRHIRVQSADRVLKRIRWLMVGFTLSISPRDRHRSRRRRHHPARTAVYVTSSVLSIPARAPAARVSVATSASVGSAIIDA